MLSHQFLKRRANMEKTPMGAIDFFDAFFGTRYPHVEKVSKMNMKYENENEIRRKSL